MQTLDLLKSTVLNSQDKNELFSAQIELTEIISSLHQSFHQSDSPAERKELRSKLSLATELLEVCKERKRDVSDLGARLNYNFRMAAKTMLKKETYNQIMSKATLPRKEVKAEQKELRENRLQ